MARLRRHDASTDAVLRRVDALLDTVDLPGLVPEGPVRDELDDLVGPFFYYHRGLIPDGHVTAAQIRGWAVDFHDHRPGGSV